MADYVPVNAADVEDRTEAVLVDKPGHAKVKFADVTVQEPTSTTAFRDDDARKRDVYPPIKPIREDQRSTAASYGALALLTATIALSTWLFPNRVGSFLFGDRVLQSHGFATVREALQNIQDAALHGQQPPQYGVGQHTIQLSPLISTLLRLLGTALGGAAVSTYVLRGAALADKLHLNTYKRLEVGLLLWALTSLALFRPIWSIMTRPAGMLMSALPTLVLAVAGPRLLNSNVFQVLGHTISDLRQPRTSRARLYALLVPAFAAAGISYILAPKTTMQLVFGRDGGPAGQVLWQLIGSGLHLVPFVSLNLKKAADAHRLGASTHILENLGLGAAGLGHLLALGMAWRTGLRGPAMLPLLGTWLLATLLTWNSIPADADEVPEAAAEALLNPTGSLSTAKHPSAVPS